jgi:hypothetical protein
MSPVYLNYVDCGTRFTVIISVHSNGIGMMISKAKKC